MSRRFILYTPVAYALIGSVVLLIAGERFSVTASSYTISALQFTGIWIGGLAVLFLLYIWLLRDEGPTFLLKVHVITTFTGLPIFFYMLLPWSGGRTADQLLSDLGWMFFSSFVILIGSISMLILIVRKLLAGRSENGAD